MVINQKVEFNPGFTTRVKLVNISLSPSGQKPSGQGPGRALAIARMGLMLLLGCARWGVCKVGVCKVGGVGVSLTPVGVLLVVAVVSSPR